MRRINGETHRDRDYDSKRVVQGVAMTEL